MSRHAVTSQPALLPRLHPLRLGDSGSERTKARSAVPPQLRPARHCRSPPLCEAPVFWRGAGGRGHRAQVRGTEEVLAVVGVCFWGVTVEVCVVPQ